ncbi:MAG: hypothetical protein HKP52_07985, partial [Desulfofustis sp.]|nr:hypothetical protein [Desulfofustis sp.]
MKILQTLALSTVLHMLIFVSYGYSALQITPSTAFIGDSVEATVSGVANSSVDTIRFQINFGDGTVVKSPVFNGAGNFSFTATHTYSQAGNYTISALTTRTFAPAAVVIPPSTDTETRSVTIQDSPVVDVLPRGIVGELPRGIVGEEYEQTLYTTPAGRSNRYRITRGKLPPGLEIDRNGNLTGVPTKKGAFTFSIQVTGLGGA